MSNTASLNTALPAVRTIAELHVWAREAGIPMVRIDRVPHLDQGAAWIAVESAEDGWWCCGDDNYSPADCERFLANAAIKSTWCLIGPFLDDLAATAQDLVRHRERVLLVEREGRMWPFGIPVSSRERR